jgi:uncharacterized delta-60 repeat protein
MTLRALAAGCALIGLTGLLGVGAGAATAAPGGLDPRFGSGGKVALVDANSEQINALALAPGGKVVVAGSAGPSGGEDIIVYRLNPDGSRDSSFDGDGKVVLDSGGDEFANAVAVQPDGKVVVAGRTTVGNDAIVYRLLTGGSRDLSFDVNGEAKIDSGGGFEEARAVALRPDGKIVVAGITSTGGAGVVYRLKPNGGSDPGDPGNGALDPTFDTDGAAGFNTADRTHVRALALLPDGRMLLAGSVETGPTTSEGAVLRVKADGGVGPLNGALDTTFDGDGEARITQADLAAIAVQPDGKIVVAGSNFAGTPDALAYRLRSNGGAGAPNGALDPAFSGDGKAVLDESGIEYGQAITLQPDGKVLIGGLTSVAANGLADATVWRLTATGARDPGFGANGLAKVDNGSDEGAFGIARQPDGRIVVGGQTGFSMTGETDAFAFRLFGDPFALTVARSGSGAGAVTSAPAGIACGAICSRGYDVGTPVTLRAAAAKGSRFAGWSGGGCAGTGECAVTVRTHTTVGARFTRNAPLVKITKKPRKTIRTRRRSVKVKFSFRADQRATLRCRIDRKPFKRCTSPKRFTVKRGRHRFQVRASNPNGTGPTASYRFKVVRRRAR